MTNVKAKIAHALGAVDHYHDVIYVNGEKQCRAGSMCATCHPETARSTTCLMMGGYTMRDISTRDIQYFVRIV